MSDDDQNWIDALAGRETADSPTRREAEALREALRANAAPAAVSIGADPDREHALLARAVHAGLLPARPLRPRWPLALAAGVVLALGLGFAMHRLQISGNLIERGAEDGVVRGNTSVGRWSVYSVSPGIVFRSNWQSTDRLELIYSSRFYGDAVDNNPAQPLDRDVVALGAYLEF